MADGMAEEEKRRGRGFFHGAERVAHFAAEGKSEDDLIITDAGQGQLNIGRKTGNTGKWEGRRERGSARKTDLSPPRFMAVFAKLDIEYSKNEIHGSGTGMRHCTYVCDILS